MNINKHLSTFESFLNERATDAVKLKWVTGIHEDFVNECRRNIGKIIDALFSEAYYSYQAGDLTISITIDELLNTSGDEALGQYTDETRELVITLFPALRKIRYGTGYIGIGMIDDLEEISEEELEIYTEAIKSALTDPSSQMFGKIKSVFMHELVHHWDNVNYGAGYVKSAENLEKIRHDIEDAIERDRFYFGMPHEINARFVQALALLIDNHGTGYGDYQTFEEMFLNYFLRFSALSGGTQTKIRKRLFYFFENDLKKFD